MRKKSKSQLKKLLWKVFADYVKKRDNYICFTCGRKAEGHGLHAGHFIPKSIGGLALYFHEENVRAQCYNCNINLGGNQYEYGIRLGEEKVAELKKLQQQITKDYDYEKQIEYYKEKITEL